MNAANGELRVLMGRREEFMSKIEQLRSNGQLPTPKGVALAIMDICRRDDATNDAIARVVQTDPALSGRLLRLANAAAVQGGRPVAAVPDAIMRLGLGTVRQVAMGFSLVDQYQQGPCKAFDYARFWSHSLLMAVAAQALGAVARLGSPDELFACGLMARIGRLALATVHPVEYAELLEKVAGGEQLSQLERERLQADHNDFTAAILADCGIPGALLEPVYHHEKPDASGFADGSRPYQLVHLFYHAKRVADMGLAVPAERSAIVSELMLLGGKLGLDLDDLGSVVDRIVAQWQEWGAILKVPAGELPSFAAMAAAPAPKVQVEQSLYPPMRVLLVEDDPATRAMMSTVLSAMMGREVYSAANGREALALALQVMPQIVVTDWLMPVMDGLDFCRALRATEWGQSMYVIMLTGVEAEEDIVQAFEAGVDDYVTKPLNVRALRARMRAALHYVQLLDAWEKDRAQLKQFSAALAITNRKLQQLALTDMLTGLPNRRAGLDTLSRAWTAANRSGQTLAVMMLDIDRFKSINDCYGHAVGDKVLHELGRRIRTAIRKDDEVCRLGGEEFLVICQNTDLRSGLRACERVLQQARGTAIHVDGLAIQTTLSIGLACKDPGMMDAGALVNAADKALYGAKQAGRDRAAVYAGGRVLPGVS